MTETSMMQHLEELMELSVIQRDDYFNSVFFLSKTNWIQSEAYLRLCTKGFDRFEALFLKCYIPSHQSPVLG